MPIFGWIRDALGIRKDLAEVKKTKLEIANLKAKQRERNRFIRLASFEETRQFDPKIRDIERHIPRAAPPSTRGLPPLPPRSAWSPWWWFAALLVLLFVLGFMIAQFWLR